VKIVHISDCYLPRLGGIEVQVHDLAAHQLAAGYEVEILTCTPATQARGIRARKAQARKTQAPETPAPGNSLLPVRRMTSNRALVPSARTRRQLHGLLSADTVDAVHIHSSVLSPFAWTAARLASAAAIPTVVTMHSIVPSRGPLLPLSASLLGWPRWPVAWSAVSDVAAAPLRSLLGSTPVSVLPNGIDPTAWHSPQPRRHGAPLTIVSVMRLAQRKRPLALLRTLAAIRAALPADVPLRAVLIGEGPQRPRMERYLRAEGMQSWVTLTGRLTRAQIRPLLAAADVYLAPAELESFGIAALEARCAGLPVVAMAQGGVGEFIRNGQEGFLVHSDREMVKVTADLLTSPLLRVMQERNRRSEPEMTWPHVVGLSLDLYLRGWEAAAHATSTWSAAGQSAQAPMVQAG